MTYLALVRLLEGCPLVLVHHGQHARNALAHAVTVGAVWCDSSAFRVVLVYRVHFGELVGSTTSDLGDAQGTELNLQVLELWDGVRMQTLCSLWTCEYVNARQREAAGYV